MGIKIKSNKIIFLLAGLLFFFLSLPTAFAQSSVKQYYYSDFISTIKVNTDSTLDIQEQEQFVFEGEYHTAFRNIPLGKVDAITDIQVIDAATNRPLVYSSLQLDKTLPTSWGKYTFYKQNGDENIAWYFNETDSTHGWIIKYKVHGALGFYNSYVRLYWNIFSGFSVPISNSQADVFLPAQAISAQAYRNGTDPIQTDKFPGGSHILFTAHNFAPNEAYTIDISMPTTAVSRTAYWQDFTKTFWGYLAAVFVLLLSLISALVIWLKREKLPVARETIIPQYEPPENLKPAMAEAILYERVSNKGFAATLVDLAVRGYLKIEEDNTSNFPELVGKILGGFAMGILGLLVLFIFFAMINSGSSFSPTLIIVFVFIGFIFSRLLLGKKRKDYKVTLRKPYASDSGLEEYEKMYLGALFFDQKDYFTTYGLRSAGAVRQRALYEEMKSVTKQIYNDTQKDTQAFDVLPHIFKIRLIFPVFIYFGVFIFTFGIQLAGAVSQGFVFGFALAVCAIALWAYVKFEPRLNRGGIKLKGDWEGFRMFLKTAERYRLQNLTPLTFQKYLPYAMVFGIEKQWAKAFEGMDVPPPGWYGGGTYVGGSPGSVSGGFSPVSFSTSFSTAFSSSFGSSGGGGAGGGGGGGGAGGGGGGGGGGAG